MNTASALAAFLSARTPTHRDDLVAAYFYLCVRAAKKFYRAGADRADLTQVGVVGLLKAIDQYDAALRTPFEAYAWLLVVGELMHYVRDHERIMRIPRRLRALEKRYNVASEMLHFRLGRKPGPNDMAAELAVDVAVIDEIRLLRRGSNVVSIEAWTGSPTGELAARCRSAAIDDRLALVAAIEDLAEREQVAILGSFAADLSQAEIGQRLGLSQSQVSKLLKKALGKIHRCVA